MTKISRGALFFLLMLAIFAALLISVAESAWASPSYSVVETATALRLTHNAETHTSTPVWCGACGTQIVVPSLTPTDTAQPTNIIVTGVCCITVLPAYTDTDTPTLTPTAG